jgi:hypothetical protein
VASRCSTSGRRRETIRVAVRNTVTSTVRATTRKVTSRHRRRRARTATITAAIAITTNVAAAFVLTIETPLPSVVRAPANHSDVCSSHSPSPPSSTTLVSTNPRPVMARAKTR